MYKSRLPAVPAAVGKESVPKFGTKDMRRKRVPLKVYGIILILCVIAYLALFIGSSYMNSVNQKESAQVSEGSSENSGIDSESSVSGSEEKRIESEEEKTTSSESEETKKSDSVDSSEAELTKNDESLSGSGAGSELDFSEYSSSGKRYTDIPKTDRTVTVNLEYSEVVSTLLEINEKVAEQYLSEYAAENELDASRASLIQRTYSGEASKQRLEFYFRFNDPQETMVTMLYDRTEDPVWIDVLPCQYTYREIKDRMGLIETTGTEDTKEEKTTTDTKTNTNTNTNSTQKTGESR